VINLWSMLASSDSAISISFWIVSSSIGLHSELTATL